MRTITFQGNPLTLIGEEVSVGEKAPVFSVVDQDMKDVAIDAFKGKIKVISVFPSLDTPVCDLQVKEFNKRSVSFGPDVAVVGISKDLPFAQKRFCTEHDITTTVLSDYKTSSFGMGYGLLIKELNLLARAVIIVDANDVIRYVQVVPELTTPPDYDDVIKNLETVVKNPVVAPVRRPWWRIFSSSCSSCCCNSKRG